MTDFYRVAPGLTARQTAELTDRQFQVLRLVADGRKGPEIAAVLGTTPDTVKTHLIRIRRKLGARDRPHAVATAFRLGLLQ